VSNAAKIAVPLLLVAAGAAWFYLQTSATVTPVAPISGPQDPEPAKPAAGNEAAPVVQAATPTTTPQQQRESAPIGTAHADAEQGVRGRVLLPTGEPAVGVPVHLMGNVAHDIAQIFINNRTGRLNPPLASCVTDKDGSFALGLRKLDKAVDLRIVPEECAEFSRQAIRVRELDWYDTGDIVLEAGVVLTGRVVDALSKNGIANATVFMSSTHQSQLMVATPGRERGTPMTTDANGWFLFANGPRQGTINLYAEATSYAAGQLVNQALKLDGQNELTIELDQGLPLAGIVCDATGNPIAGAMVSANGLSAKTPQTGTTTTGGDGRFGFPSMRVGPYAVTATSTSHAETRLPLVMAGDELVKVVMATRGSVKLRVLAANGQPAKAYRIGLMRHFPQSPQSIGRVMEWADRSVTPGDFPRDWGGEFALIKGLPTGDFRFQITENNHAKTMSQPFTVVEGGEPVEVIAQLTLGGTITGVVQDDRGRPVANATVSSDMNGGLAAGTGIFEMFRTMMPEKHTTSSTRTNAQGRFKLSKLAYADYMIRASHPDYCEGTAIDLKLETEGQAVDAGVITLALGAIFEGTATIGGQPAGQVKITISTPMTVENLPQPGQPDKPAKPLFNATVQTDNDGRFRLLKRVPPGKYKATAQRPSAGGDPFGALLDIRETEREVQVAPGQDMVTVAFALNQR